MTNVPVVIEICQCPCPDGSNQGLPQPNVVPESTTFVESSVFPQDGNWIIDAHLVVPAEVPLDIFIYVNTGTDVLGEYIGVTNLQDYSKLRTWTGVPVPIYQNKFVKHTNMHKVVDLCVNPSRVTQVLIQEVSEFRLEYLTTEPLVYSQVI